MKRYVFIFITTKWKGIRLGKLLCHLLLSHFLEISDKTLFWKTILTRFNLFAISKVRKNHLLLKMYNHNVSKIYIYNRFFFHLNMNRLSKFEELNCIFRAQSSYKHCDRWNCWNSHLIDHFGYCNFHQEVRNILDYEFPNRNSIISQTTSPQATVWSPHNSLFQTREDHTSCTYWSWFATMGIKTI